jgi:hypothetical protein
MLGALALIGIGPSAAQKLVDPTAVAPEYRAAAEKRLAEQIRQRDCRRKADQEKVLARDRVEFLAHCLDGKETSSTTP